MAYHGSVSSSPFDALKAQGLSVEQSSGRLTAPTRGAVEVALEEQEKLVATLGEEIARLTSVADRVLVPVPAVAGAEKDNVPPPARSALAETVAQHNSRLRHSIRQIREITERIDL